MKAFGRRLTHSERLRRWRQQIDLVVVVALFVVTVLLFGFVELADEVGEGAIAFEEQLMLALRGGETERVTPATLDWFDVMWINITALGSFYVVALIIAIVLGYLIMLKEWRTALVVIVAIAGAGLGAVLLKDVFARPRPDVVTHLVEVSSQSFPSGHSMVAAVTYPTLGALLTRLVKHMRLKVYLLTVAMFLTVLIGLSRVFLGVHYPTDVLAGWMLGLGWGILCWLVLRSLQRRHVVEPPGVPPDVEVASDSEVYS